MKKFIFFGFVLWFFFSYNHSFGQVKIYQANELDNFLELESRPIVFFIHTDWCKICHQMKNTTLKNEQLANVLNTKFYFVSLNAEIKTPIVFNGNEFVFKPVGMSSGVHELAEAVGSIDGKLSYPTISILNDKKEIIFVHDSFMTSDELLRVLTEVEDAHP